MYKYFVLTLGTSQDGGYPHIGCFNNCCLKALENPNLKRYIASIAIIDKIKQHSWIIDITPNINDQLKMLKEYIPKFDYPYLSGIFLTHAHIGHYTGLLNIGLETMNLKNIPVYVLPKMGTFLNQNSMFNQLIENNNIIIKKISVDKKIKLSEDLYIKPFLVPHRNELSETAGFKIISNNQSIIYLPDIDSWDDWNIAIIDLVKNNDILLLDGTFYTKKEIKNRDVSKIPHPSISETMILMNDLKLNQREKIYFTHLNHTNKVINNESKEYQNTITSGYKILEDKKIFHL